MKADEPRLADSGSNSWRIPRLVTAGTPVYCAQNQWIQVYDAAGVPRLYYVERVERLWKKESGLHATELADGSRRRFEPEVADTNGRNPCLVWILGERHPWYFDSGHESVSTVSQGRHGGTD